jgi:F420-non-reducing hydrogenase large subunit
MGTRIQIDPVTRLEGHGRIDIFLGDDGEVEEAYFQVPEFRGFEKFSEGRAVEEMPTLTQKICGVCPTAHHIASTKTLDALFSVEPPPAARKIRELMYSAFMFEDHLLHFYALAGPDLLLGPEAPKAQRNILGVIAAVGTEVGTRVLGVRRRVREMHATISGSPLHPVCGLPGGVSRPIGADEVEGMRAVAAEAQELAQFTLKVFDDVVLANRQRISLLADEACERRTYYMGLVDENDKVNFYDGTVRVVDPDGEEFVRFQAGEYAQHLEELAVPWSYMKVLYLKSVGWKGFSDGRDSGIYRVAPLARLNASGGMATPLAQAEYERMYDQMGGKPTHHALAYHWARLVEVLYAAERMRELLDDPGITDPEVRTLPTEPPREGVGVCEAPRGTLFHHYATDENGIVRSANLIVATQNNAAAICMAVRDAARKVIKGPDVSEGALNSIEMAFRVYDPCLACATHSLPGEMPLVVDVRDARGELIRRLVRD